MGYSADFTRTESVVVVARANDFDGATFGVGIPSLYDRHLSHEAIGQIDPNNALTAPLNMRESDLGYFHGYYISEKYIELFNDAQLLKEVIQKGSIIWTFTHRLTWANL